MLPIHLLIEIVLIVLLLLCVLALGSAIIFLAIITPEHVIFLRLVVLTSFITLLLLWLNSPLFPYIVNACVVRVYNIERILLLKVWVITRCIFPLAFVIKTTTTIIILVIITTTATAVVVLVIIIIIAVIIAFIRILTVATTVLIIYVIAIIIRIATTPVYSRGLVIFIIISGSSSIVTSRTWAAIFLAMSGLFMLKKFIFRLKR